MELTNDLSRESVLRDQHEQAHWYEVGINNRYRYLLVRCRRELRYMMADISAGKIPHDGDGLHELLRDLDTALIP